MLATLLKIWLLHGALLVTPGPNFWQWMQAGYASRRVAMSRAAGAVVGVFGVSMLVIAFDEMLSGA